MESAQTESNAGSFHRWRGPPPSRREAFLRRLLCLQEKAFCAVTFSHSGRLFCVVTRAVRVLSVRVIVRLYEDECRLLKKAGENFCAICLCEYVCQKTDVREANISLRSNFTCPKGQISSVIAPLNFRSRAPKRKYLVRRPHRR